MDRTLIKHGRSVWVLTNEVTSGVKRVENVVITTRYNKIHNVAGTRRNTPERAAWRCIKILAA